MEVPMTRTEEVISNALAVVAAAREERERDRERRGRVFGKIEIGLKPSLPKGTQLRLDLH